jgi:hypothetical protein
VLRLEQEKLEKRGKKYENGDVSGIRTTLAIRSV